MKRWWFVLGALAVGLGAAACRAAPAPPPAEIYRGTMRSGCAPHDAPSTEIELHADDSDVLVLFNLWPDEVVRLPSTIEFDAEHLGGQASYCTGPDECEPAAWGRVVLESPAEGEESGVRGEWTLGLHDGRVLRGGFIAEWLTIQAMCG